MRGWYASNSSLKNCMALLSLKDKDMNLYLGLLLFIPLILILGFLLKKIFNVSFYQFLSPLLRYFPHPISWNPRTWWSSNFHIVQRGIMYRSKTLTPRALKRYIRIHRIKTILNIREADAAAPWYQNESAIARDNHITLVTVTLDERHLPTAQQLLAIGKVFETVSEKNPLLIHCKAGADRVGLVSALWVMERMYGSREAALRQLRIRYGHYRWHFPLMTHFVQLWYTIKKRNSRSSFETRVGIYQALLEKHEAE